MGKSVARVELETYLGALEELEAQRASLARLRYLLKRGHLLSELSERNGRAWLAVWTALEYLQGIPIYDSETTERLEALKEADRVAYRAWRRGFFRTNLGPIAHRYLDVYEAVIVPPAPALPGEAAE
jgi:hypothetical protein